MFELKKLKKKLGETNFKLFQKYKFFVAGGAITSIFTNQKINDFDVYARKESDILNFLKEVWDSNCKLVHQSNKATLIKLNGVYVQLIHFKYYDNAEDVFDTFDFTVCMGAFDFKDQKFHLHRDFLKHNSQRILVFNSKTSFPLISAIRINKYKNKNYRISDAEYIRIILACMALDIKTWRQLKEHFGGMYGVNVDEVIKFAALYPFDLHVAIESISEHAFNEKKTKKSSRKKLDDVLYVIQDTHPKYLQFKDKTYKVHTNGSIVPFMNEKEANHIMLEIQDVFKDTLLYKFVKKQKDGTYTSYYCKDLKYVVGEVVRPISNKKHNGCIYVSEKDKVFYSHYFRQKDKVLLEIAFSHDDLIDIDRYSEITIEKGYVVREVPQEEWETWRTKID